MIVDIDTLERLVEEASADGAQPCLLVDKWISAGFDACDPGFSPELVADLCAEIRKLRRECQDFWTDCGDLNQRNHELLAEVRGLRESAAALPQKMSIPADGDGFIWSATAREWLHVAPGCETITMLYAVREADRLKAHAERYQWLRENWLVVRLRGFIELTYGGGKELDETIDRAKEEA